MKTGFLSYFLIIIVWKTIRGNLLGLLAPNCGIDTSQQYRIAGGENVQKGEHPWAVYISMYRASIDAEQQLCVGTLISNSHVLTAKHCLCHRLVDGIKCKLSKTLRVRVGSLNRFKYGFVVHVSKYEFYMYKDFNLTYPYPGGDLAILKLQITNDQINEMRQKNINPICLPNADININAGMFLTNVGWGKVSPGQYALSSETLKKVELEVADKEDCAKKWQNPMNQRTICTIAHKGKDNCKFDSGGPLMLKIDKKWYQIGCVMMSSGLCGSYNAKPSVSSNLYHFKKWITQTVNQLL